MSTAILQEPPTHHVSLPNHPFQAMRAGLSLGIPKTLTRLHRDAGNMAAMGRETHFAGVEREVQVELLSMTGGLWLPVSYNFRVKALLMLSAETRNQHPVLLSSNAPKVEQNHELIEPLCESQAAPLTSAA